MPIRRKKSSFVLISGLLVLFFTTICYGWQGRMAGMGDPFGLVEDESDFLIHPSKVAKGQGVKYYSDYRFNYRDVKDWDYTLTLFNPTTGALLYRWPLRSSGDEYEHDGLIGVTFPLMSGRMGLLLQYTGRKGDYDGKENEWNEGTPYFHRYNMDSDLDAFSLRLLYGLPMGDFKVGGEIQLAYRQEENETFFKKEGWDYFLGKTINFIKNDIFGQGRGWTNLFPFMFPFDSNSYEALFKGSLDGALGAAKISFTAGGGLIFSGDNKLKHNETYPSARSVDMDGDVEGWRLGGDFWLRYPLKNDLSVPLVLRIEYRKKTRDGDGPGTGDYAQSTFDYENEQRIFQVEAGGGIDKELSKGTKIACGLYYRYLQNRNDFFLTRSFSPAQAFLSYNHSDYPDQTEHRLTMRLLGEKEFSGAVTIRMGLNFFYGWVKEDYKFELTNTTKSHLFYTTKTSLDGHQWGINASLGSTFKFQRFSIEPFLGGGFQKINLKGNGYMTELPGNLDMDKTREEWLMGGGLSVLF